MKQKPHVWTLDADAQRNIRTYLGLPKPKDQACLRDFDLWVEEYAGRTRGRKKAQSLKGQRDHLALLLRACKVSQAVKNRLEMAQSVWLWDHPELRGYAVMSPDQMLRQLGEIATRELARMGRQPKSKGGRNIDRERRLLVSRLARVFHAHTNRKATPDEYGPFSMIVGEVFRCLNLPGDNPRKIIEAALTNPRGLKKT